MSIITVFSVSVGLAMDCFAVSVACSSKAEKLSPVNYFLPSFSFGLFQSSMFLAGLSIGRGIGNLITAVDHWVAFGLLAFIGFKMIFSSQGEKGGEGKCMLGNPYVLLVLSVATSVDALVVGLGLGFIRMSAVFPTVTIGFVAFLGSLVGMKFGRKFGALLRRRAGPIGGFILIGIGVKILIDHIF